MRTHTIRPAPFYFAPRDEHADAPHKPRSWPWIIAAVITVGGTAALVGWAAVALHMPISEAVAHPPRAVSDEHAAPAQPTSRRVDEFAVERAAMDATYDRLRRTHPKLAGDVVARLIIAPDGHVQDVAITRDTVGSPELRQQLMTILAHWQGPPRGIGAEYEVPFRFRPPRAPRPLHHR